MSRRKRKRRAAERSKQHADSPKKTDSDNAAPQLPINPPRPNRGLLAVSSLLLLGGLVFLFVVALSR